MSERVLLLALACVGFFLSFASTLWAGPSRLGALMALASLVGFVLAAWLIVDARRALQTPPAPPLPWRPLDQEEYAALLRHDGLRNAARWAQGPEPFDLHCRGCGRRPKILTIYHPIWEGPAVDGAGSGSGRVDTRTIRWCVTCDTGPLPSQSGPPVRLPYLDQLPVRLLPELYAREAFHELAVPVERYIAPPPASVEAAAPDKEIAP